MLTEVVTAELRGTQLKATIDGAIERLVAQLAEGHTDEYRDLLAFWSRFHRYSHGNVVLIRSQRPDATQVAGFHAWRRLGRRVRKGSKAVWIWCPILHKEEDPETGNDVERCAGFTPCPVYAAEDLVDIAQGLFIRRSSSRRGGSRGRGARRRCAGPPRRW